MREVQGQERALPMAELRFNGTLPSLGIHLCIDALCAPRIANPLRTLGPTKTVASGGNSGRQLSGLLPCSRRSRNAPTLNPPNEDSNDYPAHRTT
jgi:hypothetical protein